MHEKTNDIGSNLIFYLYRIYKNCHKELQTPKEWSYEKFNLVWDGNDTLRVEGTPYSLEVRKGAVYLDEKIQYAYQVPYEWLQRLAKLGVLEKPS